MVLHPGKPLSGQCADLFGDYVIVSGGWSPSGHSANKQLICYNYVTNQISTLHLDHGPSVLTHSSSIVGNFLFMFGGTTSSGLYLDKMVKIDLTTKSCEKIAQYGTRPSRRSYHRAVVINRKDILIFGGQTETTVVPKWHNDVHIFDTTTSTWRYLQTTGDIPAARGAASVCAINRDTEIIVFGGGSWKHFHGKPVEIEYFNDVHILNLATLSWRKIKTKGEIPGVRAGHSANILGNVLLVTGGYYTTGDKWPTYKDCFVLDLDTFVWKKVAELPAQIGDHSVLVCGQKLILLCGLLCESTEEFEGIYSATVEFAVSPPS